MNQIKLIEKVMEEHKDPLKRGGRTLAQFISQKIDEAGSIQYEWNRLITAKVEAIKIHNEELKRIDLAILAMRERCKHYLTSTSSDPSGGTDRSISCEICGKDMS